MIWRVTLLEDATKAHRLFRRHIEEDLTVELASREQCKAGIRLCTNLGVLFAFGGPSGRVEDSAWTQLHRRLIVQQDKQKSV